MDDDSTLSTTAKISAVRSRISMLDKRKQDLIEYKQAYENDNEKIQICDTMITRVEQDKQTLESVLQSLLDSDKLP